MGYIKNLMNRVINEICDNIADKINCKRSYYPHHAFTAIKKKHNANAHNLL